MIIAQTPFRISFFGGGTDFPGYYREHGGAVLATTINQYAYLSIHRLSPLFRHNFKASYARTESVQHPSEFQHPLIRECLLYLRIADPLEIAHVSDLPGRTGLGTSSSFTVGLLHALHAFRGDEVNAEELAREAIIIERERVGDTGGHQDQYAAAYGGLIRMAFKGEQQIDVTKIKADPRRIEQLQQHLHLFFLGTEMSAETILKDQNSRTSMNQSALSEMCAMVEEGQRILEGQGDLTPFGDLLHESWIRKRGLAGGITNDQINTLYDKARGAGARGGKVLGAGGRGFMLLFTPPDRQGEVETALRGIVPVPFRFSDHGSRIIFQNNV